MRTSMIAVAIGLTLREANKSDVPEGSGQIVIPNDADKMIEAHGTDLLTGTEVKVGTLIPAKLVKGASDMVQAFWDLEDKRRSASNLVLTLAGEAVQAARGEYKLALTYFRTSIASAVSDFREAHKESDAETKLKIEEFLDPKSSWAQYVSNVGGALVDRFPIMVEKGDPSEWTLKYPSEHALRNARQAIRQAKNHARAAVAKLKDTLDMSEVTEDQVEEARNRAVERAKQGATEAEIKALLQDELVKRGAVELSKEESEEKIEEREEREEEEEQEESIYSQTEDWASIIVDGGEDIPAHAPVREGLAKLMRLVGAVDLDTRLDEVQTILNNACVKLTAILREQANHKAAEHANGSHQGPQVQVGP